MTIQSIRQKLEQFKGAKNQIQSDLERANAKCTEIKKEISYSEKAQSIIKAVAATTQQELEYRICEPVSLALSSVYDDPYKYVADFKITGRDATECHLRFERNGNVVSPKNSSGGGPIDISEFASRIGSWSLQQPRSRPIIIADEPFKFVDKINGDQSAMFRAGQMLKDITKPPPEGLGLQVILITHIEELVQAADQVIEVSLKNKISHVEVK